MIGGEICNPLAGMGHNLLVHTVLEIFLLVSVEEKIEACEIAE